jgi:hypothetical protein
MADNVQLPGTGQIIAAKADPSGVDHQEVILANTAFTDVNPATADNQAELIRDLTTTEKDGSLAEDSGITVADLLLKAMDKAEGLPLQVQLPKDFKQDQFGALIQSDMAGPYIWQSSTASQPFIIDCTGYESVLIHKITTGVVTPYVSNDNKTFSATLAVAASTTIPATTILTAAGMYIVPVTGRYLQLVGPASAIQCFIYLSVSPYSINPQMLNTAPNNVSQFGGYNIVTAGVNGIPAFGGNIAPGVAPTTNPVLIGGADALGIPLTRRILTDQLGRIQIGNIPSQRSTGMNFLGFDPAVRNVLEVQDTSVAEGMEVDEVMIQVLFELRILNQQMYELPRLLRDGLQNVDQPEDFRDDMGIFNQ